MRQELFEKMLSWDKLSPIEKLEAVKWLVSAKIENILLQRIALAIATKKKQVEFLIGKSSYSEDLDDIETFLSIMDCDNPQVEYSSYEWEVRLRVKFKLK